MIERPTLKITWNAGFFSCTTDRLRNLLKFHHENNILPYLDSSEQYELYKDDGIEDINRYWAGNVIVNSTTDITDKFFEVKKIESDFLPQDYSTNCKFPTESKYDQFGDYTEINYDYLSKIIDQYFSPSSEVLRLKDEILNRYQIKVDNTIGVCFRGNDKNTETNLPSYDEMSSKIDEVLGKNPNNTILVQTDETEFADYIKSKYPNSIILDEVKRINRSRTAIQYTIAKGERVITAQKFLAIMFILSQTSSIILNSGNVGLWVCLLRKNQNNIYQYLNEYGSENKLNKWLK